MKIGYARVSTVGQDLNAQIDALHKAGCEKIFQEKRSGLTERPELIAALEELRAGDVLVVWALDRLGRELMDILRTIAEIHYKKAYLQTIVWGIDTTLPSGRVMVPVFSLVAELEISLQRERRESGQERARAAGRLGGRPSGLSEKAKQTAERAKKLYLCENPVYSAREIAEMVQVSTRTLYKYLRAVGVEPGKRVFNDINTNI